jgi:hypothetical protein
MNKRNSFQFKFSLLAIGLGLLILALASCGNKQTQELKKEEKAQKMDITKFFPEQAGDWRLESKPESYQGDSIFAYMDGAGEVYRMYDFQILWVATYTNPAHPDITAEIFDMGIPQDAYGIFLHSRDNDTTSLGIGQGSAFHGGVLMFWRNMYYVNIVPEELTTEAENASREIGSMIADSIGEDGEKPELVDFLPNQGMINGSLRYFHLFTTLNYHYYLADSNILNLDTNTNVALARYEPGQTYMVLISYLDDQNAYNALKHFADDYLPEAFEGAYETQKDHWTAMDKYQRYLIIVFDAQTREDARKLIDEVKTNLNRT